MGRRTKIVCTLGPASETPETLRALIRAGMDVARINFSHGGHDDHGRRIAMARAAAAAEGRVLAILADLQGPKLRIGEIAAGRATLVAGETFTLTGRVVPGDARAVRLPHPELLVALRPGDVVLLDDGLLELRVRQNDGVDVLCDVVAGGELLPRKGVSVPHAAVSIPAVTEKDRADLAFALSQDVDYIAQSFVRQAEDVIALRALIVAAGRDTPIIAKIEKPEAIEHLEAILSAADGVMVARGDLGVEMPAEQVPLQQKRIIQLARAAAKPVITATQMLESMIHNPRPTRAEASDVANAIFDGTDAIMLSAETAVGQYPVAAVEMMARIAGATEPALPYGDNIAAAQHSPSQGVTDAVTQATCEIAYELNARAIAPATASGYTARMVARHRPATPILVITPSEPVRRRLALVWGVQTVLAPDAQTTDEMIAAAEHAAMAAGLAASGDTIVITAGIPLGGRGKTNMLKVHVICTM
jgi:pyruvate kinase